ncbi:glycerophosphodiester phosphodiesterase family protein [Marinifilum caeruleilacunae]|uniref:PKD domain-containing protein n=1 Tax=Marinifilum caeruleilacunae TaxID=2499076 RepID=A0ABX1WRX3_9BACT|nr:glycerophosphodiester phosphodiesterase family protein [Marinifilum caeruleilacunae]NOU58715.1 PKD domain-containing protein [Marinifilum caeruleilacunae]
MKQYLIYLLTFILALPACTKDDNDVLKASFTFSPENVVVGNAVQFTNESLGTDEYTVYAWNFGDGTTSDSKNPIHTYRDIGKGIYEVSLTIKGGGTENTFKQAVQLSLPGTITGRKSLKERLASDAIVVCAHRACHQQVPENSIAAIQNAIDAGIDMVEIDIRSTNDGELVLMHDATVDRTTNGTGKVSNLSLEAIRKLKLYDNSGRLTDEQVPTLKEVLKLARGKIYIDLDISKKATFEKVYPLVKQFGMLEQVMFYSSELQVISNMSSTDDEVLAMPMIRDESDFNTYSNMDINLHVVHYSSSSFNERLVQKAKDKGWKVFVNAYVNSSTTPSTDNYGAVDKARALEGNIIQTDYPIEIKQYLQ